MIVCRSCGQVNEDAEASCQRCGEFLEWSGVKVRGGGESRTEEANESRPTEPSDGTELTFD